MDVEALSDTARTAWVVWLTVLFVGVAFWAFRPNRKKRSDDDKDED
jgi:cytochrome c oxidase cbb3-type subunit 4